MNLKINIIDAFANKSFQGNPAAVIITEDWLSEQLMQSIATENNLSETAFVKKLTENSFQIRWYSPIKEIDFCGHATLAAAFVIFSNDETLKAINFYAEAVGNLEVTMAADNAIEMCFPNTMPNPITEIPQALLDGLSLKPLTVLLNNQAYFAIYSSEADVLEVKYNSEQLKQLAPYDVVVTAAGEIYDFVSRYFWPASGGDEDPVTGSIHTGLAPYWAHKLNKNVLRAYQASKRGGTLHCVVDNDKVYISGYGVQYLTGTINL